MFWTTAQVDLSDLAVGLARYADDKEVCNFIKTLLSEVKDTPLEDKIYKIVKKAAKE